MLAEQLGRQPDDVEDQRPPHAAVLDDALRTRGAWPRSTELPSNSVRWSIAGGIEPVGFPHLAALAEDASGLS